MEPKSVVADLKRMSALLRALARAAGAGTHDLSVVYLCGGLTYQHSCDLEGPVFDDSSKCHDVHRVASLLLSTAVQGGMALVVLRTPQADGTRIVKVWQVRDLHAHPVPAAMAFDAFCSDEDEQLSGARAGRGLRGRP